MKITILGSGSWGTALGQVLADNNHDVTIYGINQEEINDINNNHKNEAFFKDVLLNEKLYATTSLAEAMEDCEMVVTVIPTKVTGVVLKQILPYLNKDKKIYIVNASKGFDPNTHERMSETIRHTIPSEYRHEVCSIIGPSHAEEVVIRCFTTVASVSIDESVAQVVQETFANKYFRLYTLKDEIGAEYGVALKNVMALAAGFIAGMNLGDNTKAALLTRGLAEMTKYGVLKGGKKETFMGLTGIGDLIVTATSPHSRNFQAGYSIGKYNNIEEIVGNEKVTVEGIRTCKVVYEDSISEGVELPIITGCYQVLYENRKPMEVIFELMNRELKAE